ncbi:helix-turn-helix domain-containing protein [Pseudomonas sp. SWRI74]|uniref:Helix-turn-helix domain-containing protein n=1 Tax=Pseudomonas azerbaijanoccidentalis TaxID=2842347 RepID=A0ABS6R0L9_9PSED|nr:helix-turn-helix domain-containing protein [Pseudomonas azerbaijanoccidentalis]
MEGEQFDAAPANLAMFEPDECGEGMSPSSRAKDEEQALRDVVASRLVRARRAAGLKDLEVAKRLGHSNLTMISLFENGHRSPSLKNLQVLADLYEVTTDYLLGRTDDLGLAPEEGNQALITGVLTAVLGKYNQRYLEGLARVTAISVEGASMDRVLLGRVAEISIELSDSLAVIRKHHGSAFEGLRGGGKLERLISELSVSVKDRIASKQRESALIEFDHPVCTVQQVSEAVQQALF